MSDADIFDHPCMWQALQMQLIHMDSDSPLCSRQHFEDAGWATAMGPGDRKAFSQVLQQVADAQMYGGNWDGVRTDINEIRWRLEAGTWDSEQRMQQQMEEVIAVRMPLAAALAVTVSWGCRWKIRWSG